MLSDPMEAIWKPLATWAGCVPSTLMGKSQVMTWTASSRGATRWTASSVRLYTSGAACSGLLLITKRKWSFHSRDTAEGKDRKS